MHLHYFDRHRLPEAVEKELNLAWHPNVEDMVKVCDVVTINAPPLHPETEGLFNDKLFSKMKRGAYLVNTARGQNLRSRRHCPRPRKRPARRLRRRCLVPPTRAPRPPVAHDAASRHDAVYFGNVAFGAGPLCRRYARDLGVLVRGPFDPPRISDRRRRQARRSGRAFLQRWRCDRRIRGGCKFKNALRNEPATTLSQGSPAR